MRVSYKGMVLLLVLLASCSPEAMGIVRAAAARAEAFDLEGALELARSAGPCDEAAGGADYLEGLVGAREAVAQGGTDESLREVRSAANALAQRAGIARRWEIGSLLLRAVAAASQYERAEMGVFLAEATRLEAQLVTAGLPSVPFVSAHELAGDLWLQVDRYSDAREAYLQAAEVIGSTPRVRYGLARVAARANDTPIACAAYRLLLEWWGVRPGPMPPPIAEAHAYTQSIGCAGHRP